MARYSILGIEANYPSPEDFILLKLIPGRPKDRLDVEAVLTRHAKISGVALSTIFRCVHLLKDSLFVTSR